MISFEEIKVGQSMTFDMINAPATPHPHADDNAASGQKHCLGQKLEENVALLGADRHADADLPGSLGHRDEHDVHNAHPFDNQGNGGHHPEEMRHHPGKLFGGGVNLEEIADHEVPLTGRADPVTLVKELC